MAKTKAKPKQRRHDDEALRPRVVEMRRQGQKWNAIAAELKVTEGKAQLLLMQASVKPKDRIKGRTDKELAARIVKARDEQALSWGQIVARSGLTQPRARKLYADATGRDHRGKQAKRGGGELLKRKAKAA